MSIPPQDQNSQSEKGNGYQEFKKTAKNYNGIIIVYAINDGAFHLNGEIRGPIESLDDLRSKLKVFGDIALQFEDNPRFYAFNVEPNYTKNPDHIEAAPAKTLGAAVENHYPKIENHYQPNKEVELLKEQLRTIQEDKKFDALIQLINTVRTESSNMISALKDELARNKNSNNPFELLNAIPIITKPLADAFDALKNNNQQYQNNNSDKPSKIVNYLLKRTIDNQFSPEKRVIEKKSGFEEIISQFDTIKDLAEKIGFVQNAPPGEKKEEMTMEVLKMAGDKLPDVLSFIGEWIDKKNAKNQNTQEFNEIYNKTVQTHNEQMELMRREMEQLKYQLLQQQQQQQNNYNQIAQAPPLQPQVPIQEPFFNDEEITGFIAENTNKSNHGKIYEFNGTKPSETGSTRDEIFKKYKIFIPEKFHNHFRMVIDILFEMQNLQPEEIPEQQFEIIYNVLSQIDMDLVNDFLTDPVKNPNDKVIEYAKQYLGLQFTPELVEHFRTEYYDFIYDDEEETETEITPISDNKEPGAIPA